MKSIIICLISLIMLLSGCGTSHPNGKTKKVTATDSLEKAEIDSIVILRYNGNRILIAPEIAKLFKLKDNDTIPSEKMLFEILRHNRIFRTAEIKQKLKESKKKKIE